MRNKLYEKRVELLLTPQQHDRLKKYAKMEGCTVSELIRDLIKAFLREN